MSKHKAALLAILLLVICIGTGSTIAYLTAKTTEIVNAFVPGEVPPVIEELFDGSLKENVRIKNNGNTSSFVRAAIIACWKDKNGNLAPEKPILNQDYVLEISDSGWQKYGNYYYCLTEIMPEKSTPVFIESAYPLKSNPDYILVLDIISQAIQAKGADTHGKSPIELAWNVRIENGNLFPSNQLGGGIG